MMSLFSPFDLFFFNKNLIRIYLVVIRIFIKSYYFSRFNFSLSVLRNNLTNFFFTLKPKSFNKISRIFFFSIFFFLLRLNFFSVFSYNFPYTSQVRVVFSFSLSCWLGIVIFGIRISLRKFLYHFIPEGTPLPLTFLLFLIEVVRNLIRPLTLIVRLVANILAGHLLIILLSKLVFIFLPSYFLYIVLNIVEIFVSLIQSYIFSTMLVLYFSEV